MDDQVQGGLHRGTQLGLLQGKYNVLGGLFIFLKFT